MYRHQIHTVYTKNACVWTIQITIIHGGTIHHLYYETKCYIQFFLPNHIRTSANIVTITYFGCRLYTSITFHALFYKCTLVPFSHAQIRFTIIIIHQQSAIWLQPQGSTSNLLSGEILETAALFFQKIHFHIHGLTARVEEKNQEQRNCH